jgi:hypothetical protein
MRHYSCDLCSKDLTSEPSARYVVQIAAYPVARTDELTEADLDQDHLEAMAELLEELEDAAPDTLPPTPTSRTLEYDLCPTCYCRFLADPLGREAGRKLHFSKN